MAAQASARPLRGAVGGVKRQPGRLRPVDLLRGVGVALGQPQQRTKPGGGVGVGVPLRERVALLPVRHPRRSGPGRRCLLLGGLPVEFGVGAVQLGRVPLPVLVAVGALQLCKGAGWRASVPMTVQSGLSVANAAAVACSAAWRMGAARRVTVLLLLLVAVRVGRGVGEGRGLLGAAPALLVAGALRLPRTQGPGEWKVQVR